MSLHRSLFLFVLLFILAGRGYAQDPVMEYKDSLNSLTQAMQRGENDSIRKASAMLFSRIMETLLTDSSSFETNYDSIRNVSVKTAPDNLFRLYTWQYPNYAGDQYHYFGYVQYRNPKNKKVSLFTLSDSSAVIAKPSGKKLKPDNWYGCIYYQIISNQKGKKHYYTLMGWKGKNRNVTQKLIDVITFDSGKPVFGYPVFKVNNIYHYRIIFEFDARASMILRYESDRKLLVFDHLSAGRYSPGGPIGPDGSYDAFRMMKKGYWELQEDVDVNAGFTPKKKPVKVYKDEELRK